MPIIPLSEYKPEETGRKVIPLSEYKPEPTGILSQKEPEVFTQTSSYEPPEKSSPSYINTLTGSVRRGVNLGKQSYLMAGAMSGMDVFDEMAEINRDSRSLEPSAALKRFGESKTIPETLMNVVKSPQIIPELIGESLPAFGMTGLPLSVGLGAAGGVAGSVIPGAGNVGGAIVGGATGAGMGSLILEFTGETMDGLSQAGVDVTNSDELRKAFANEELMDGIRKQALKKGIPVAVFDALSLGVAGKVPGGKTIGKKLLKIFTETGIQGAMGGSGELAGQLVAGKELSAPDIIAEIVAEIGTAPAEVFTAENLRGGRIKLSAKDKADIARWADEELDKALEPARQRVRDTAKIIPLEDYKPEVQVGEERSNTDATGAVVEPPQEAVTQVPKAEVATEAVPKSEDVTVKPEVKRAEDTEEATVAEDVADVAEDQVVADEAGTADVLPTVEKKGSKDEGAGIVSEIRKDVTDIESKDIYDRLKNIRDKGDVGLSTISEQEGGKDLLRDVGRVVIGAKLYHGTKTQIGQTAFSEFNTPLVHLTSSVDRAKHYSKGDPSVTKSRVVDVDVAIKNPFLSIDAPHEVKNKEWSEIESQGHDAIVFVTKSGLDVVVPSRSIKSFNDVAPTPTESQPVSGVKEPWQMTQDEYGKSVGVSEKESFGIVETQSAVAEPNSTTAKLSFGEEVVVGKKDNFHTYTNPKSGKVFKFDVVRTKSPDGRMRFIANYGGSDQVAAGIVIDSDGRAITAKAHETGTGLIQSLLREAKQDFGKIIPQKPISKQGLRALHRSEIQQALSEGKPVPPEVLNDYPDLAKKHGKKGNAKAQDKIKTISGEFTYDEFEARGYEPSEVTQSEWVLLMRSLRRSLGQDETSGNPNAPYAEYKEFHRRSVEDALKSGDTVDERVLQSYPDLKPEAKPAEGNGEIKKAEEIKFFEDEIKKTKKSKASEISDVGTFSTYKTKQSKINALQEELDNARKRPARLYNTQPTPTAEEQLKPKKGKGGGLLSQERNLPAPTKERKGFEVTARLPVAPIKTEGKKRLSELKFDLGKTFGRKVEKGKISRRALGTYFPWSGRVVIKYAGDLDSASHEIGHYLDDLFGFMPELFTAKMNKAGIVQRRMNEKGKPMRAELESFWQHGSVTQGGPRSRLDYKLGEAAAEWVRAYIMNPEATRKQAPLLTAHILGKLDEKARTGLTKISDQVRGWAGRSATERVLSNVKIKPKRSGRLGEILDSFEKSEDVEFHTTWIDRMWNAPVIDKLYPFFRAIQTAKDLRGIKNLNPMKDPYILTRLLPGIETVIEDQFENGAIDFEKWNEGKFERDADVKGVSWLLAPLDNSSTKTLERDMGLVIAQLISERTIERADVLDRQSFRKLEKDIERFLDNRSQAIVNSRNLSKEEKDKAFESIADMREILGNARSVEGAAVNKLLVLANEFPGKFGKLAQREYQSNKFRKQRLSGIGGGIFSDLESAKETLAELDNLDAESRGRISEAADRYRKFADAMVLKPLLHSGRISKVQYDAIKEDNQFYVNMSRVMEDAGLPIPQPSGKRLGAVSEPIKKFKGGTREMENPYVSLLGQATLAQREASRNKALVAVRDLLTIHRGINEGKPINLASIGKKTMAGDDNTIKIFVDGKPEYWKFESGVYKAMKSWGQTIDNNILLQVLRLPAKILRVSITHSPPFIIRNVIRDTVHRTVISRTGSKITDIKIVTEDDISKLMAAGGGQFGHYMKNPFNYYKFLRRSMLELSKDPFTILVTSPAKLARRYNKLSQSSEYVNRLAEFRSAIKKFQKEGFSEVESMTKAALEARDLMDFSRSGYVTEYINSFIPFTNAAVQGIRRTALAAKENPGKFTALWGLYVLAPTLLMYAWNNRDDDSEERYHDTSPWYRDFYWNMYLGDKLWLRVPKPFEIGVLASGVERTIDNFRGYENAYDGYGEAVVKSFLPFDQSSLLGPFKTVIETMTNYDTFRNRNIVSKWEVDKPIEERKGTKYASKLGQIMQDLSKDQVDARIIDHVVRSQFADLGRTALDISNIGEADKKQTLATWLKDAFGIFGQNSEWVARDLYINRLNVISEKNDNRASAMRQNWNSKHPEYKIAKRKGKYVEN